MQRRKYLTTLGVAAGALLAGCLGDDSDSNPDETGTDGDDTNDTDGDDVDTPDDSNTFSGPVALTQAVLDAASAGEVDRFKELLHPLNPVSDVPDEELNLGTFPASESESTVETQDPSVETIYEDIARVERTLGDQESQLRDALSGDAAIVSISLPETVESPGQYDRALWVVAPNENGQLRLLFQGVPAGLDDLPGISTQVLANIVFDSEAGVARLELPADAPTGELSVRTGATRESFSIGPETQETPTISIAEDGGELAVDFRQGDEVVPLHRELYGDQRVVEDITIEQTEQEDTNRAQLSFTDQFDAEEITLATTRVGGTATATGGQASEDESESTVRGIEMLNIGIAPEYDELTVSLTRDGDREEVHRERLYYS